MLKLRYCKWINFIGFHSYDVPRVVKPTKTETRMVVVKDWKKGGNRRVVFNGYKASIWEDEEILEMDDGNGGPTM